MIDRILPMILITFITFFPSTVPITFYSLTLFLYLINMMQIKTLNCFISEKLQKISQFSNSLGVWICFINLMENLTYRYNSQIKIISLCCFIANGAMFFLKETDTHSQIIKRKFDELEKPIQCQIFLEKLLCLSLEDKENSSKRSSVLLNGYIRSVQENHSDVESWLIMENYENLDLKNKDFRLKEREYFLDHIWNLYLKARKKFPEDINLRISFMIFLAEFASKPVLALEEIYLIEEKKLSLENSYIIEGVKKILDKNGKKALKMSRREKSTPEFLEKKVWEELEYFLEKCTTELILFWNILLEDSPPVDRVYKSILLCMERIEKTINFWEKKRGFLSNVAYSNFAIGYFLKKILNRKIEGEELIKKAIQILEKEDKCRQNLMNIGINSSLNRIKDACVIIKQEKFSLNSQKMKIVNCNIEFGKKLGYLKQELIGLDFEEILIAESIKKYFDFFKYFAKKKNIEKYEKMLIALKKKNKFMEVDDYDVRILSDNDDSLYLILSNTKEKMTKQEGWMMINSQEEIIGYNPSAFKLFGFKNTFGGKGLKLSMFIDIDMEKLKRMTKTKNMTSLKCKLVGKVKISCYKFDLFGAKNYVVKIHEDLKGSHFFDKSESGLKVQSEFKLVKSDCYSNGRSHFAGKNNHPKFYFFFTNKLSIEGRFVNQNKKKRLEDLKSTVFNPVKYLMRVEEHLNFQSQLNINDEKINYAEGIKTKRLVNGNIIDWYPGMDESFMSDEEEERITKIQNKKNSKKNIIFKKEFNQNNFDHEENNSELRKLNNIANLREVESKIQNSKFPKLVKFLLFTLTCSMTTLFLFELSSHSTRIKTSENLGYYTDISYSLYFAGADLHAIMARSIDTCLLNNGSGKLLNLPPFATFDLVISTDFYPMNESLLAFENYIEVMEKRLSEISLSSKYLERYRKEDVEVISGGKINTFSLQQAIRQIKIMGLTMYQKDKENVVFDLEEFKFLYDNLNGNFRKKYEEFVVYTGGIKTGVLEIYTKNRDTKFIYLAIFFILSFSLFYCLFRLLLKERDRKLETYYYFKERSIKLISEKYENFLRILQMKQFVDYEFDISEGEEDKSLRQEEEMFSSNVFKGKKHKKGSLNKVFHTSKILIFFILSILVSWIVKIELDQQAVIETSLEMLNSIETISKIEFTAYSIINTMLLEIVGLKDKYMDKPVSFYRRKYVNELLDLNDDSIKALIQNYKKSKRLNELYTLIYQTSSCSAYYNVSGLTEQDVIFDYICNNNLAGGLTRYDFSLALTELFSTLVRTSEMIDYYLENKNSEWKYTDICIEYAYLENWQRNLRCIFDTVFFGDMKLVQRRLIKVFYREISSVVKDVVLQSLKDTNSSSLNEIIQFCCFMMICYFLSIFYTYFQFKKDKKFDRFSCYIPPQILRQNTELKYVMAEYL